MIWHSTDTSEVLNELQVDGEKGLANGMADLRLERYGENVITKTQKPTYLKRFLGQLRSKIVIVLMVTAVLSFVISLMYNEVNSYSPLLIIGIVVINAAVSAYYIHKCDNAIDAVKSATNPTVRVIRDGIIKEINSALLVPGDIILLSAGDYISADARIIKCSEFRCNENALTGEEVPVEKTDSTVHDDITAVEERSNMVFSGSSVVHGNAKAVVVATGINTEIGMNSAILEQTGKNALPVESELTSLSRFINIVILFICAVVFIIGMIQNFKSGNFASMTLKVLCNSIALAVAAIPEGLPAIATIVIAIGLQRIIKEKIVIKDSNALETLGKTDILCCDKTGVLTRNKMVLSKIYNGDNIVDLENEELDQKSSMVLKMATACSTLDNDSTEDAIKEACLSYNSMSPEDIENMFPSLAVIPFDSERKTMTVISMMNERPFAVIKGAPEIVLPNCVGIDEKALLKINDDFANDTLRVVCIAMKPLDEIPANPNSADIETGLIFVGLLGLSDPPRETVVEDIKSCETAGIRTVMITGDNLITASSVARKIGILKDGTEAITGEQLSEMSDDELARNIEKYSVFARVSPGDKLRIVRAFKRRRFTVTITGDNANDADALSEADVGCAIGKFGTDIARGSADIVISANRFSSIVYAVKESRGLFQNIKKAVYYFLSCNFAELLTVLVGMLIFRGSPLSAVQLLWINLLTDSTTAISLAMENAEERVMKRKSPFADRLLDVGAVSSISLQSVFIAGISIIAYALGLKAGSAQAMTMAFAVLGISQVFHCYNCKFEGTVINKTIFANRFMNLSSILTLFIVIFLLFTPAGYVFGLTALSFKSFAICLGLSFLTVPFCELTKLIRNKISA